MIGPEPMCYHCKHFRGETYIEEELRTVYYCAAFPDGEGIPNDILLGRKHTKPIKGDHGIRFESADH